jgi:hypothetical protein
MKTWHRTSVLLVGIALLAVTNVTALTLSLSGGTQLEPISGGGAYGNGYGGALAVGFLPLEEAPVELLGRLAFHSFPAEDDRFDTAGMIMPGVRIAYAPRLGNSQGLVLEPRFFAGYQHYFFNHTFQGEAHRTYRPVLSSGGGLLFSFDSLSVGPQVSYNLFFDDTPQSVMELELLVRYRFGGR